jgi:heme A synthase
MPYASLKIDIERGGGFMISHPPHRLVSFVLVLGALVFITLGVARLILDLDLSAGLAYLYDGLLFLLGSVLIFLAIRSARSRYH